jgi:hypothetical protein
VLDPIRLFNPGLGKVAVDVVLAVAAREAREAREGGREGGDAERGRENIVAEN